MTGMPEDAYLLQKALLYVKDIEKIEVNKMPLLKNRRGIFLWFMSDYPLDLG